MESKEENRMSEMEERDSYMVFHIPDGNVVTRTRSDSNSTGFTSAHVSGTGNSSLEKEESPVEGDNLSCMVDRMMGEISPKDNADDVASLTSSLLDQDMGEVSPKENEIRRPPSLFESTHSIGDISPEHQSPPILNSSHRPPNGPFVMGDQLDIMTESFTGRMADIGALNQTSNSSNGLLVDNSLYSPEPHSIINQMLMGKIKWIRQKSDHRTSSAKKMLDYQTPSRPIPRQQKVRTDLSLREKVRLINMSETTGKSQRSLAAEFHISVGSVNNILRRKREYLDVFEKNEVPASVKSFRYNRPQKKSSYDELQSMILKWVELARTKMKLVSWPVVIEKSREFASKLNILNFNSSGLWLENLKRSLGVLLPSPKLSLKSDGDAKLLAMWHKMVPFLIQGYEPENIFTATETALYYKCLPDKCFVGGAICKGTHHYADTLEHRLTVLLCCNALGERLKPLVISPHTNPASLAGVLITDLPVTWHHHPNAVITPDIFAGWLRSLDAAMGQQRRQIALFMDMTPSHLASTVLKHISLKFYLDDSAHLLQPLNQGVIQTFKACYRRRLLQTTLARASNTDDSLLALQGISELDAIFWIQETWRNIRTDIISTCFRVAAFPQGNGMTCNSERDLAELEHLPEDLPHLIEEAGQTFKFTPMLPEVYAEFDSQLPCHHSELEDWESRLLLEAAGRHIKSEPDENSSDSSSMGTFRLSIDETAAYPDMVSPVEALDCLTKLKKFSAANMPLLTTVYELESLLLDSLNSHQHPGQQFPFVGYPGFNHPFQPFTGD